MQEEDNLSETVQLVGKDSLGEDQKVLLEIAKIIREDFLQQNAFSEYDYNCPLHKSVRGIQARAAASVAASSTAPPRTRVAIPRTADCLLMPRSTCCDALSCSMTTASVR